MSNTVRFSFRRTLQLVDFEPIQFGVDFETNSEDGEAVEATIQRAYDKACELFNDVQGDVLESFEAPGATRKTSRGGTPPSIAPADPTPPPKKRS